jgi:hypothetical protein
MELQDWALVSAGLIGAGVAIVHGLLVQRFVVRPYADGADARATPVARRLMPPLIQFSTFNWFASGAALIAAAFVMGPEARLATGFLAGSSFLFGAVANLWATRGRHPGWVLYAAALALIAYGLS